jgi:hypothetical protein
MQQQMTEKERRMALLVAQALVRVTTTFYGPDLHNHSGTVIAIDQHSLYPYAVKVQDIPGYPDGAIRSFAWYELDLLSGGSRR